MQTEEKLDVKKPINERQAEAKTRSWFSIYWIPKLKQTFV